MKQLFIIGLLLFGFTLLALAQPPRNTKKPPVIESALGPMPSTTPDVNIEIPELPKMPPGLAEAEASPSPEPSAAKRKAEPRTNSNSGGRGSRSNNSSGSSVGSTVEGETNVNSNTASSPQDDNAARKELDVDKLNTLTNGKYSYAVQTYYEQYAKNIADDYTHKRSVLNWQYTSSRIIFYLVIFLVLTGVFFSGVQFYRSFKPKPLVLPQKGLSKEMMAMLIELQKEGVTELSVSGEGLKVSSPVLGVIILALSLIFFYLYLWIVYPINKI